MIHCDAKENEDDRSDTEVWENVFRGKLGVGATLPVGCPTVGKSPGSDQHQNSYF